MVHMYMYTKPVLVREASYTQCTYMYHSSAHTGREWLAPTTTQPSPLPTLRCLHVQCHVYFVQIDTILAKTQPPLLWAARTLQSRSDIMFSVAICKKQRFSADTG
jgi:hypothetical protein